MNTSIIKAAEAIRLSRHAIAFTGAGISVESGIPPFRGEDGLWSKYDPDLLELSRFHRKPQESWVVIKEIFYDFFGKAKPNAAHRVLARMESKGIIKAVVTQNIDNLHQEAGSQNVLEFHGTAHKMVCTVCNQQVPSPTVDLNTLPPLCPSCKGILKPDFIFFGEGIPEVAYRESFSQAELADVVIIVGSTGEVMPACQVPIVAKRHGAVIIEINPEASLFTRSADIHIKMKAGEAFVLLEKELFG